MRRGKGTHHAVHGIEARPRHRRQRSAEQAADKRNHPWIAPISARRRRCGDGSTTARRLRGCNWSGGIGDEFVRGRWVAAAIEDGLRRHLGLAHCGAMPKAVQPQRPHARCLGLGRTCKVYHDGRRRFDAVSDVLELVADALFHRSEPPVRCMHIGRCGGEMAGDHTHLLHRDEPRWRE